MIELPQVMLCAVTSVALAETCDALRRSSRQIRFGDVALLTDHAAGSLKDPNGFRQVAIQPIASREAYSRFMIEQLADHATHDHVLIVQWDGFVCHPPAWTDEFLQYDYIGAPWPQFAPPSNVGNGGFSLRSRRLLEALAAGGFGRHDIEDLAICRDWRPRLEAEFGIRFAPPELAGRFSFERHKPGGPTFGFHGLFNFPAVLPEGDLAPWLTSLSAERLAGRDGEDLIIALIKRRRWADAASLVRRRASVDRSGRTAHRFAAKLISALAGR